MVKCRGDGIFSNLTVKPHFSGIVTRGYGIANVTLPEPSTFVFSVFKSCILSLSATFPSYYSEAKTSMIYFSPSTETNNQKRTAEKLPFPMRRRIQWSVSPSRLSICYEELRVSFIMITLPDTGQSPGNLAQIFSVRSCWTSCFQEKSSLKAP